jgi:hypothetical protein
MSLTVEEIKERLLAKYDPDDIIELFQLTTEDLLDRFEDKMLHYMDTLAELVEEEDDEFSGRAHEFE